MVGQELMAIGVILVPPEPLDLASTLASGQSFRWRVDDQARWIGVIGPDIVRLVDTSDGLLIESAPTPPAQMAESIADYFRFGDDLSRVQQRIAWDDHVRAGIEAYPGMRILRQDPWQTLASFILSSTSNIPRISRTVELLAETFGDPVSFDGVVRYTFPTPADLAEAGETRLRELGCGFRAPYLTAAASAVAAGSLSLDGLRSVDYEEARQSLIQLRGVGEKIADCAMLFSLDKMSAFPADRWVLKVLHEWYLLPGKSKYEAIRDWAVDRFSTDAGYANQYLFWHVRQLTRPLRSTATIETFASSKKAPRVSSGA